jgi:hypothetical protein
MMIFLGLLLLRCFFWFVAFPNPDEAYYWLWGQHPAWSYYDHPAFTAWIQGLFTAVLGRSPFVLRLPNVISNVIFFGTYYCIIKYIYPDKNRKQLRLIFGMVVLAILTSPLYFLFLALAWPDHFLITFSLIAGYQFIRFLDSYLADGRGQTWRLWLSSGAIALALLCKYNAIFLPLGFLAAILADKRLRPLLRDGRLYSAIALAATALIPIGLWNLENDWLSWRYYLDRSVNTGEFSLKFGPFLGFILFSFLLVSPMHCINFYRSLKQQNLSIRVDSVYRSVAFWIFLISTLILIGVSLLSAALYYWNITAYLLLFPLLPAQLLSSNRLLENPADSPISKTSFFKGEKFYGLLFATLFVIHYSLIPVSALISRDGDPDSRMLYGWAAVGAIVQQQIAELGMNSILITTDYRSASALAYQLHNSSVIAISDRRDQFDIWFPDLVKFQGRNAVILADDWHPATSELLQRFEWVAEPTIVPVMQFGIWIKQYYILKGYRLRQ